LCLRVGFWGSRSRIGLIKWSILVPKWDPGRQKWGPWAPKGRSGAPGSIFIYFFSFFYGFEEAFGLHFEGIFASTLHLFFDLVPGGVFFRIWVSIWEALWAHFGYLFGLKWVQNETRNEKRNFHEISAIPVRKLWFGGPRGPKWLTFGNFCYQQSINKSTSFPDVEKVGSGTQKYAIWGPADPQIINFAQESLIFHENCAFRSEFRFGPISDRTSSQNELQKPPKWRPKCEKKHLQERGRKIGAKLMRKYPQNGAQKPPQNHKKN
jgi:hypothetical protein